MSDNPYKVPDSDLEVNTDDSQKMFYVVSKQKFALLFFSTLGIYLLYWFYKNWQMFKESSGKSIWPVPRAIFSIFFTHSLFREVDSVLNNNNKKFDWKPETLATIYVIFAIASQVLDRMAIKEIGSPYTDLLSILILPVIYLVLAKSQEAINLSQNDPEGQSNSTYTAANYVWIVLGLLLWAMVLFGFIVLFGFVNV